MRKMQNRDWVSGFIFLISIMDTTTEVMNGLDTTIQENTVQEERLRGIRKMLGRGDSYQEIADFYGITTEEVKSIENEKSLEK